MSARRSRLGRVRRVFVGGLVGGAFVLLDRRRRQREAGGPPGARGGDPLAPFADAPCYRERSSQPRERGPTGRAL